jgi:thymidylate synthase ThyX
VYAQESLRFAVKTGISNEVAKPPSLVDNGESGVFNHPADQDLAVGVWEGAVDAVATAYETLVNMGVPAEDARGLLPHNITTRVHYKTNLRNLLDHAGNRLCTQAQFEWRVVFSRLVDAIRTYEGPGAWKTSRHDADWWQFRHIANDTLFAPVCYALGHCPFMADFDRKCSIRSRVNEGKFDEIDPAEWLLDPAAGRKD